METATPEVKIPNSETPQAPEAKKDSHGITIISMAVFVLLSLGAVAFLYYQNQQLKSMLASYQQAQVSPTPESVATATSASVPSPLPSLKPGWKLYQNEQYGFEFSHPAKYKVLTDSENLYGWPKAILLLYGGGQSYDMPVEVWGSEAEYKAKYPNASGISVYKTKDGKFITLFNQNKEQEIDEVISTFKFID